MPTGDSGLSDAFGALRDSEKRLVEADPPLDSIERAEGYSASGCPLAAHRGRSPKLRRFSRL
ncbi:MAG TPA: hypothetical protein VGJ86_14575 [Acidimicrobiales bacterium]|jgi:hypothetical protein